MGSFKGIPAEAFEFYEHLASDNTKSWWNEHKHEYEQQVRQPLTLLLSELADEFGEAHLFRPYRDVRFSKDKTPIKDHQGGYIPTEDAVGYYVQVSASGLMVAGGWYAPSSTQLKRYREAIDAGHADSLRLLLDRLDKQGWQVEGNRLKTRPKGIDPDHPDLDLLRFRMLTAERRYPAEAWMGTSKALTKVRTDWRQIRPLVEWLTDRVGPSS